MRTAVVFMFLLVSAVQAWAGSAPDYRGVKLLVFISSSMPDDVIRSYIKESEDISDSTVFVLRGFVKGMKRIRPTLSYVRHLLCGDEAPDSGQCLYAVVDINPGLYRMFKINEVPAFVVLESGAIDQCGGDVSGVKYFVSRGDADLKYHLDRMERKGSLQARALLNRFKNPYIDRPRPQ